MINHEEVQQQGLLLGLSFGEVLLGRPLEFREDETAKEFMTRATKENTIISLDLLHGLFTERDCDPSTKTFINLAIVQLVAGHKMAEEAMRRMGYLVE